MNESIEWPKFSLEQLRQISKLEEEFLQWAENSGGDATNGLPDQLKHGIREVGKLVESWEKFRKVLKDVETVRQNKANEIYYELLPDVRDSFQDLLNSVPDEPVFGVAYLDFLVRDDDTSDAEWTERCSSCYSGIAEYEAKLTNDLRKYYRKLWSHGPTRTADEAAAARSVDKEWAAAAVRESGLRKAVQMLLEKEQQLRDSEDLTMEELGDFEAAFRFIRGEIDKQTGQNNDLDDRLKSAFFQRFGQIYQGLSRTGEAQEMFRKAKEALIE